MTTPTEGTITISRSPTVEDLEEALGALSENPLPEASTPPPSSWPDLLRLTADIFEEGIPLLEGGKKTNVLQLLLVFAKLQAAWQAFKALRKPQG